jgi:hypothetical protein
MQQELLRYYSNATTDLTCHNIFCIYKLSGDLSVLQDQFVKLFPTNKYEYESDSQWLRSNKLKFKMIWTVIKHHNKRTYSVAGNPRISIDT